MKEFIHSEYSIFACVAVGILVATVITSYICYRRAWEIDQNNIIISRAKNNKESGSAGWIVTAVIVVCVWLVAFWLVYTKYFQQ